MLLARKKLKYSIGFRCHFFAHIAVYLTFNYQHPSRKLVSHELIIHREHKKEKPNKKRSQRHLDYCCPMSIHLKYKRKDRLISVTTFVSNCLRNRPTGAHRTTI